MCVCVCVRVRVCMHTHVCLNFWESWANAHFCALCADLPMGPRWAVTATSGPAPPPPDRPRWEVTGPMTTDTAALGDAPQTAARQARRTCLRALTLSRRLFGGRRSWGSRSAAVGCAPGHRAPGPRELHP